MGKGKAMSVRSNSWQRESLRRQVPPRNSSPCASSLHHVEHLSQRQEKPDIVAQMLHQNLERKHRKQLQKHHQERYQFTKQLLQGLETIIGFSPFVRRDQGKQTSPNSAIHENGYEFKPPERKAKEVTRGISCAEGWKAEQYIHSFARDFAVGIALLDVKKEVGEEQFPYAKAFVHAIARYYDPWNTTTRNEKELVYARKQASTNLGKELLQSIEIQTRRTISTVKNETDDLLNLDSISQKALVLQPPAHEKTRTDILIGVVGIYMAFQSLVSIQRRSMNNTEDRNLLQAEKNEAKKLLDAAKSHIPTGNFKEILEQQATQFLQDLDLAQQPEKSLLRHTSPAHTKKRAISDYQWKVDHRLLEAGPKDHHLVPRYHQRKGTFILPFGKSVRN